MLAALLLLTAASARAVQTLPGCNAPESPENPAILAVNNSVSLAYLNANLDYIEPSDGQTPGNYADYEDGSLNGVRLAFSWMNPAYEDLYLHAEWDGATGHTDYVGFTEQTIGSVEYFYPATGISGATVQDYAVKIGKGIATGNKWMLTPYASFGGRHWTRVIGEGTSGDYNETYQHYYAGFGSLIQYSPADRWVITGDALFGRTFYAWMNDPPDGFNHAALGDSPIIKFAVEADTRLTQSVHGFVGFDYTYFSYGESDVNGFDYFEPISRTQMYDVTVGVRFSY